MYRGFKFVWLYLLKVAPAFTAWRLQLRAHRGLQRELIAKQACVVSLLAAASPGRAYHAIDPKMFLLRSSQPPSPRGPVRSSGVKVG